MLNKVTVYLKKKHLIHSWQVIKYETMHGICFGIDSCEMPGQRVVDQCTICLKIQKTSLNLWMPNEYMKAEYDHLWR